jgi:acetolactate synthase-1/2/3 large subunit
MQVCLRSPVKSKVKYGHGKIECMRVSEAVIDSLVANGIDTVFGIPGKQTLPLNQAIGERDDIRFVMARHETAVSHQAWGYAETSGCPAATVVVPGPGDMNAMNGLKNALNDSTPLIHFAVETEPEIRGGEGIHETPPDTYDNVVKENILVENPEGTLSEVKRAIAIAQTLPKGPVRIGIPKNFLPMNVSIADAGEFQREFVEGIPDNDLSAAVDLLADVDYPVIVAGGGVRAADATAELVDVAERLGAPVITTYKGKGIIPDDHELAAGTLSGSASPELLSCLADADAALAVGTDFDAVTTRSWSVKVPEMLIHVTLDGNDIGTGYDPTVGIVADAKVTLAVLHERLAERDSPPSNGAKRVERIDDAMEERLRPLLSDESVCTSVKALREVRRAVPKDAVVAVDAGGFRVWALNTFDAYGPRSYVNPGSWATMGTGVPSGIGAQLSNPSSDVVVLTGDGGLMMCVHELHTAVQAELPITVVVFNNADYAIISEEAERSYHLDQGVYGWKEAPIRFTDLAESMSMRALRAEVPANIAEEVERAVSLDEPVLVEVPTDPSEPQASAWMAE